VANGLDNAVLDRYCLNKKQWNLDFSNVVQLLKIFPKTYIDILSYQKSIFELNHKYFGQKWANNLICLFFVEK